MPVTQLDIWLHNRLLGYITYEAQLPSCTTGQSERYLVVQPTHLVLEDL